MSRRLSYVVVSLLVLVACKPQVPAEFIQPDDMEDILYDYHVSQAMARSEMESDYQKDLYFKAVLKKHNVSEADFDSSLVYYYSHVDRLRDIYGHVNERLSEEARSLGAVVGDINRYSQYSSTGDTANIWKQQQDILLMPHPTMNRFSFSVKADTSFYKGDSFMFQFVSEYIWQAGSKDVVVCVASKYEGDSIVQTSSHLSNTGIAQLRIPAVQDRRLKEMEGFIYLCDGDEDQNTRRMMFVSQIQLIRFHQKNMQHETIKADSLAENRIQRSDNAPRTLPDTLRRRVVGRRDGGTPLPPDKRIAPHGMVERPIDIKK